MANPYQRCHTCKGNMWPSGDVKTHPHIDGTHMPLKLKLRTKPRGWNKAANPRTNSPKPQIKTVMPPKRAYGPF